MDDLSNKLLAITPVTTGVCVNDTFIASIKNIAASLNRSIDYFKFDNPSVYEANDLIEKDTLDRLFRTIGNYEFIAVDKRLPLPTLNVVLGFILSEGAQIGSFYVDDPELQLFLESKILLRKQATKEAKGRLLVSPNGGISESKSISEALDCLIMDNYDTITFMEGNYDLSLLYRVLAYCYDIGVILVDSSLPEGLYIKIIESKW